MVVENVSKISGEMAFDALYSSAKQSGLKKYLYGFVLFVSGLSMAVVGFFTAETIWLTVGALFGAFGVGLLIYNLVLNFRTPTQIRKSNKDIIENGVTYTYRFREKGVDLQVNIKQKKSKGTYEYSDFKKVYEFEDRFEMRLKDGDLLFVLKSGFSNDKMIEFYRKNVTLNKKLKIVNKIKNPEKLGNQ